MCALVQPEKKHVCVVNSKTFLNVRLTDRPMEC